MKTFSGKKRPRARKTLSFSEFTDYIIEHKCRCEKDLWLLARTLKTGGEDLLWNYLETKDANKMLQKALRGWHADKLPSGMLQTQSQFEISQFNIPPAVVSWMKEDTLTKSLILSGPGGCGKTEMASAILSTFGNFYFVDKLDVVKTLQFTGCESLLLDDVSLGSLDVDDCKSWLDVTKPRYARCRHEDAFLPPNTRRIFSTNASQQSFFPDAARHVDHLNAIQRRIVWVNVGDNLKASSSSSSGAAANSMASVQVGVVNKRKALKP